MFLQTLIILNKYSIHREFTEKHYWTSAKLRLINVSSIEPLGSISREKWSFSLHCQMKRGLITNHLKSIYYFKISLPNGSDRINLQSANPHVAPCCFHHLLLLWLASLGLAKNFNLISTRHDTNGQRNLFNFIQQ